MISDADKEKAKKEIAYWEERKLAFEKILKESKDLHGAMAREYGSELSADEIFQMEYEIQFDINNASTAIELLNRYMNGELDVSEAQQQMLHSVIHMLDEQKKELDKQREVFWKHLAEIILVLGLLSYDVARG